METAGDSIRARHEWTPRVSTVTQRGILNHLVTSSDIVLTRVSLAEHHSRGTSEICQGQRNVRDKGRGKRKLTKGKKEKKTSRQGVSFEAKVSENREKRFDESGRVREEQKTKFCASTVSGRNTENVIDMSSCDNKTEAT